MSRLSLLGLGRLLERLAKLSPPRHRELVRGMVAEFDWIANPADRTRFALGAIAAIARLALTEYSRTTFDALCRSVGLKEPKHRPHLGGRPMSKLTSRQLLLRHAIPFAVSFTLLTTLLIANSARPRVHHMSAMGHSAGAIIEVLLLAVPHTLALTIPMAVFVAVLWAFTRMGSEGHLASVRRERDGIRRLMVPVLSGGAVIATLTLILNTQVLPRTNARLAEVLSGAPLEASDRTMTVGDLREAALRARAEDAQLRAAAYEVEIHKKFALAAASLVLALAGAAVGIRFPHGGVGLVFGAGGLVFTGYYLSVVAGEFLAERQLISPLFGMWMANVLLLVVVLLLLWRPSRSGGAHGGETFAIGL